MNKKYKHFSKTDPLNWLSKIFDVVKKYNNWAILADLSPYRDEIREISHFLTEKPKINPFMIKSLLETNYKHLRQNAIRENFNLKPKTQLKKIHSNNGGNYTHQYNEEKEKLWPVSLF